ncbi:MAG: cobyrinate a,c-diamide synthase [Anaerolineaceae bacterium]
MRLVIGGVHSHVGKTTIVAGLIAAFRKRGLSIQPFKVGPDYIDPSYHTLAAGQPCINLDAWITPPEMVASLFHNYAQTADIAIIEGVMGLFDGQNYQDEVGSTGQIAKLTQSPVILVIDASASARSTAAIALGFQQFDPKLPLAGFIVNFVVGPTHGKGVVTAIEQATGLPVLGCLPRISSLNIPERHLGLIPTAEAGDWDSFINSAENHITKCLDIDRLLEIAGRAPTAALKSSKVGSVFQNQLHRSEIHPVIAVARDEAFNFNYQENIDLLRHAGAEIKYFSPLHDSNLPIGTSGIILSGGFPELYAREISENHIIQQALQTAMKRNLPIYAECGGLMALTQSITDFQGKEYRMLGLLPGRTVMTKQLHMGYRQAAAVSDSWLFHQGETIRGHEFHYSVWEGRPDDLPSAYSLIPPDGKNSPILEGVNVGRLWASYIHLSFWAKPELATRFVNCCCENREQ